MIVAAGLSPAWQQILRFERLRQGEVNRALEAIWCGSGKVLNVGLALKHLGAEPMVIAPLGGPAYEPIEVEFAGLGVPRRWIRTRRATRVCTTLLDEASHTTTELVEPATMLEDDELTALRAEFVRAAKAAEAIVFSGSLPTGTPSTLVRDLLGQTSAPVVLDIRGPELLAALEVRPFVVKPNRAELAVTLGRPLDDDEALRDAMRELNDRGARWVVVSDGPRPVWMSGEATVQRFDLPRVEKVVNPIGCGDCMAGGIATAIAEGATMSDAAKLGIAAAIDNLATLQPARLDYQRVVQSATQLHESPQQ